MAARAVALEAEVLAQLVVAAVVAVPAVVAVVVGIRLAGSILKGPWIQFLLLAITFSEILSGSILSEILSEAMALSSTVEALECLAAVEILVVLEGPSPQQFEIATLLLPPSPDSGQD